MSEGTTSQATVEMQRQVSPERAAIGKFLRRFAWAFEIAAVTIGLAISIATMMSNFEEMNSYRDTGLNWGDWANIFIAAIPFVMVAMVEITKIPLVGVFYKTTSRLWKWVFGACLVFVAAITFESAFNGFERNFAALMYSIDAPKKEIVTADQRIEKLAADRENLASLSLESIEAEYNQRYDELFSQTNQQKTEIQDQVSGLRASIQTEYVEELRKELDNARIERSRLISQQDAELDRITSDYANQAGNISDQLDSERRSLQGQLAQERQRLLKMEEDAQREIADSNFFTKKGIEESWGKKIQAQSGVVASLRNRLNAGAGNSSLSNVQRQESEAKDSVRARFSALIKTQEQKIERLSREIAKSVGSKEKEIEGNVAVYQEQLKSLDSQFQEQLAIIQANRDESYVRLGNNEKLVADIDAKLDALQTRRIDLVQEINEKVAGNQIYRMATWTTNKESAADVERDVVGLVAAIWFGSLAALIAIMGIFLALGSYVINDPSWKDRDAQKSGSSLISKMLKARRAYYITQRKSAMTRKEIVEVDRVVFKEVPVETVRKEFVHVPFYTNDKRLLNMDLTQSGEDRQEPIFDPQATAHDDGDKS